MIISTLLISLQGLVPEHSRRGMGGLGLEVRVRSTSTTAGALLNRVPVEKIY